MTGWSWVENDKRGDTASFNLAFAIREGTVK